MKGSSVDGKYEIKDGKLVMTSFSTGTNASLVYSYTFSDNNTKLTLTQVDTNGTSNTIVFTKK
jgi:hypothetical protein